MIGVEKINNIFDQTGTPLKKTRSKSQLERQSSKSSVGLNKSEKIQKLKNNLLSLVKKDKYRHVQQLPKVKQL